MPGRKKPEQPYFAEKDRPPPTSGASENVIFADFLSRLGDPARVKIDPQQELLVVQLQARCLKHALSPTGDRIISAVTQLCGLYHEAAVRTGRKTFEIYGAFASEHSSVQEQVYFSREGARDPDQPLGIFIY